MATPTESFFAELNRRGREDILAYIEGVLLFELVHDHEDDVEYWTVDIQRGRVNAVPERRTADCVVRTTRDLFDGFATGTANAWSAWLRTEIKIHGKFVLFSFFARLFLGPPEARHPRALAPERSMP